MATIGILETGMTPDELRAEHGSYSQMLKNLLSCSEGGDKFDFRVYCVMNGKLPENVHECDGWMITGSANGVYENLPWMLQLQQCIRAINKAKTPLIGICFGHQIIAAALGGKVENSDKGWGIGIHNYQLINKPYWLKIEGDTLKLNAMHQDQVTEKPPSATLIATSDFCPNAGLLYGDTTFSLQGHPEFSNSYEKALIELRENTRIPKEIAAPAIQQLEDSRSETHSLNIAHSLCHFLTEKIKKNN